MDTLRTARWEWKRRQGRGGEEGGGGEGGEGEGKGGEGGEGGRRGREEEARRQWKERGEVREVSILLCYSHNQLLGAIQHTTGPCGALPMDHTSALGIAKWSMAFP